LKVLQLHTPTPQTEHLFEASFNDALDRYRSLVNQARAAYAGGPKRQFRYRHANAAGKLSHE
jgi:hypothetical protein